MKNIFEIILQEINTQRLMRNTAQLLEIEKGQTFEDYRNAAGFTAGLIKDAGISDCKIIDFPADGKTVCQDKRMPLAWNAGKGRLTIKKSPIKFDDPVIADFARHHFHLVKGSVSTPQEGLHVRIITETQLFSGENAKECLVVANPFTPPRQKLLTAALDLGAIGLVTDYLTGRYDTPDGIQWVTACTEGSNWHVQSDDRPFICFSISPRTGDQLRQAASTGEVTALVECDGVRSEGELPLVTALIPGRQEKELWILSHLYEPLSNDNSNGVIASIEIAHTLKKLSDSGVIPPFEFSLRLVFAMELYGFAAFADKIGATGRKKVIGAINTDSIQVSAGSKTNVFLAPPGTPFFGNNLMEQAIDDCRPLLKSSINRVVEEGMYADDTSLSDPTTGIPTLWPLGPGAWWHNSEQKMNIIDPTVFSSSTAFIAVWVASVLTVNRKTMPTVLAESVIRARKHLLEEASRILKAHASGELRNSRSLKTEISERMAYRLKRDIAALADLRKVSNLQTIADEIKSLEKAAREIISGLRYHLRNIKLPLSSLQSDKWFEYASSIIPKRTTVGFPYDLASIPKEARIPLPDGMIYGPFARIFANMDGTKDLRELMREAEWETGAVISSAQIKKYITAISYLTDYGYLKTTFKRQYGKQEIVKALKKAGVNTGDLLMVHASLSKFGVIKGGVETVLDAMLECVGEKGTLLFPTFTRPYIYFEGTTIRDYGYRPYDPADPGLIWVGSVPKAALKRKTAVRSAHATHSVAGIGPLAKKCLAGHLENDPPTCRRSPFGKLLDFKGKVLYFGSGLAPTTFLHFLEDELDLPYLGNAVCRVKDGDNTRTILIPKHLPGHRDFYVSNAENSKFFKKAKTRGLKIKESSFGLGKIQLVDVKKLYEIGVRIIKEDPDVFLCDSKECIFCSKNKTR
jgi:aminoglycoside 3-N-acetyltransferase